MSQERLVYLACGECKRRNYQTRKGKLVTDKLVRRKHCPWCRKHTEHTEVKVK